MLPQNVSKHKWKLALHITLSKYWSVYRKASSRGAHGHDPFWSVFEEQRLDSTTTDITTALFILLIMSLYYLILWNQVDILQKHFKKDHVHMRLWTRFYGRAPYYKEVGLIIRLITQLLTKQLTNLQPTATPYYTEPKLTSLLQEWWGT